MAEAFVFTSTSISQGFFLTRLQVFLSLSMNRSRIFQDPFTNDFFSYLYVMDELVEVGEMESVRVTAGLEDLGGTSPRVPTKAAAELLVTTL